MTIPGAIQEALVSMNIDEPVMACEVLSGGCIHDVRRIMFAERESIVCKWSQDKGGEACLRSEHAGLEALSSLPGQPLVIPAVLGFQDIPGHAVLLMEWLEPGPGGDDCWVEAGRSLALMHEVEVGSRYGFANDNHIGSTYQCNDWHDDWIEFNRTCRLEPQLRWAREAGHLTATQGDQVSNLLEALEQYLPAKPRPSLLHGDLWSGNVMPLRDGRMAIIDPACSIGDGWADIAMMQLFGGIPRACFDSYAQGRTDCEQELESRIEIYQLYHVLNHVNLFGGGYVSQAMSIVDRLARR